MKRRPRRINHKFVKSVPNTLLAGVLYISVDYATAVHLCFCGCGREVVTPLTPNDWQIMFDGETVSLSPSIGNWGYPCQSHYWIKKNRVIWVNDWFDGANPHKYTTKRKWSAWRKWFDLSTETSSNERKRQ
ncbi:MAG: DUF6527 family protein [Kiritimatiellae bacterium]|jgi:hypothetical protein|nr:DUF6527 family protein [Kiritimatiellia bacterium]